MKQVMYFLAIINIKTILFIVIIIFVVILIVCLFDKFLGLNSHFQKILATVNKITASIKTLLPAALPTTAQAATITHGDVELHVDYFNILMYANQVMIVMAILFCYCLAMYTDLELYLYQKSW